MSVHTSVCLSIRMCACVVHDALPRVTVLYMTSASRNADTLKRLQDTERLQKEQAEAAYVNLDVSNEEKEKGNQVCLYLTRPRLLLGCYCLLALQLGVLDTSCAFLVLIVGNPKVK